MTWLSSTPCPGCGRGNDPRDARCRACRQALPPPPLDPEDSEPEDEGLALYEASMDEEGGECADSDLRRWEHARDLGYASVEAMREAEDMDDEASPGWLGR